MTNLTKLKTELSELEIKSAGLKKDAAIVNDAVTNIKLEISRKMADIINAKNEENEPTPARAWLDSQRGYKYCSDPQKALLDTWVHAIWEAGQKHGAGVERERFGPLVDACKRLIAFGKKNKTAYISIESAIDRLESFTTGPNLELPEKPSWAEPSSCTKFPCFSCGHPLTPIKD